MAWLNRITAILKIFLFVPRAKRISVEEYWIGKGIDYKSLWSAYDRGKGYQEKFYSTRAHLIRIEFKDPNLKEPLFNHEVIYKTIKGLFHDLKKANLSADEYANAAPIFLYRIDRGSSVWEFLGELRQLLTLGTTLSDQQTIGQGLKNAQD
ncbi:MAG TPA: hypothetical protein VII56_23285 [Rhizomicrobium sp.]